MRFKQITIFISVLILISSYLNLNMETTQPEPFDYEAYRAEEIQKSDSMAAKACDYPFDQIITKIYAEESIFDNSLLLPFIDPPMDYNFVYPLYFYGDESDFPAECIRETGENTLYVV
ncbi:MAG: hypothetical protein FWF08_00645 [Oscillospiraceae bacterium]|nr:hypothetical protein [Oscillospiraceae bacterium]